MHPSATVAFIGTMRGPAVRSMDADHDAVRSLYNEPLPRQQAAALTSDHAAWRFKRA
jgi:hypothetical protein